MKTAKQVVPHRPCVSFRVFFTTTAWFIFATTSTAQVKVENATEAAGNEHAGADRSEAPSGPGDPSTLKAERKRAAHRQRRMIMNNDGNDTRWPIAGEPRTRETFINKRTAPLVGSHVDSIFYCTGCTFNLYRHHSEESELLTSAGDKEDWGWKLGGRILMGATAAIAIGSRRGLGKLNHIDTAYLWVQHVYNEGKLRIEKRDTKETPADFLTKAVD